jgi:formimidoylglutamate deiminase
MNMTDVHDRNEQHEDNTLAAWLPDLLYADNRFQSNLALVADTRTGRIVRLTSDIESLPRVVRLAGQAILPGLVNAHSHSFQRVIRGRTEARRHKQDSFWTWREAMYSAAERLAPEDIYDAARMTFLEMALTGITTVGEFHYLHHSSDGTPYDDPNLLAREVTRAAGDVGIRICLLNTAYARSGFNQPPNPRQRRFIYADANHYLRDTDALRLSLTETDFAWMGVAPHSTRAVPLDFLRRVVEYARAHDLPCHIHIAEQPAELAQVLEETRRTPVRLLADEGLLDCRTTCVHAIHVTDDEVTAIARQAAIVCACPTTERNLGDGIVPADKFFAGDVASHSALTATRRLILLEDARALEYHLRLQHLQRAVLAPESTADEPNNTAALARRLFACATESGARSLHGAGDAAQGLTESSRRIHSPISSPSDLMIRLSPEQAQRICCRSSSSRSRALPCAKCSSAGDQSCAMRDTRCRKRSSTASPRCNAAYGTKYERPRNLERVGRDQLRLFKLERRNHSLSHRARRNSRVSHARIRLHGCSRRA